MSSFGMYGKIPSAGDFLRAGLPQGFVEPWDRWLQGSMRYSRDVLGTQWHESYMTAPIWRFTLSPGVAGPTAMMGVLMPSVDRVGRQFPLTIARGFTGTSAGCAHFQSDQIFIKLEDIALDALNDTVTYANLAERIGSLTLPQENQKMVFFRNASALICKSDISPELSLAAGFVDSSFSRPSIWTAEWPGKSVLMISDGFLTAEQAVGLFAPERIQGP